MSNRFHTTDKHLIYTSRRTIECLQKFSVSTGLSSIYSHIQQTSIDSFLLMATLLSPSLILKSTWRFSTVSFSFDLYEKVMVEKGI